MINKIKDHFITNQKKWVSYDEKSIKKFDKRKKLLNKISNVPNIEIINYENLKSNNIFFKLNNYMFMITSNDTKKWLEFLEDNNSLSNIEKISRMNLFTKYDEQIINSIIEINFKKHQNKDDNIIQNLLKIESLFKWEWYPSYQIELNNYINEYLNDLNNKNQNFIQSIGFDKNKKIQENLIENYDK